MKIKNLFLLGVFSLCNLASCNFGPTYIDITNTNDFKNMKLDGNYRLKCDIDFQGAKITPIGMREAPFTGRFIGDNHNISNYVIDSSENLIVDFKLAKDAGCDFGGFVASVYLAYDLIGTDKEHGFNNLSISPAMRNTHAYSVDSEWVSYANRGCSWSNPKMFVPINGNNEFKY